MKITSDKKGAFGFGALIQKIQNISINIEPLKDRYSWSLNAPLTIYSSYQRDKFNPEPDGVYVVDMYFKKKIWDKHWTLTREVERDLLEEHFVPDEVPTYEL